MATCDMCGNEYANAMQIMLKLGTSIDKQQPGPKRLELLRRQASVSDQLETLRSGRT